MIRAEAQGHAALMDGIYRHQRRFYDLTRAYYLLGRDRLIDDLDVPFGGRVLEIACGTGRNLDHIARRYPHAALHGLDISEEMLASARAKLGGRARLAAADACDFDPEALFGVTDFDRVVLSYSASMIPDWQAALAMAARCLAPGGELHVVDFSDQSGLPGWFRTGLRAWLAKFHVTPRTGLRDALRRLAPGTDGSVRWVSLYRDYAQYGVLTAAHLPRWNREG